ncbi:MAG: hypothetical protein EXR58_07225 [Chloroflexi bacterium]|nr:hypothetical protein [Chloroflexota bacterium]
MTVIDADCHVIENERTWSYMEGEDKKYRPIRIQMDEELQRPGNQQWLIDGRLTLQQSDGGLRTSEESREFISVDARLEHMDELGVDIQVLFPTMFLRPLTENPAAERAIYTSYNRWLADIWEKGAGRLRWAVAVPTLSISEAIPEMEWAKQHGACAVFMRGYEAGDRHLGDPYFFPLYQAAEALDMPICPHAGNSSFTMEKFMAVAGGLNFFKSPVIDAFLSIVKSKIHAEFPKLRFGFIETSSQWVPWAMHSLGRADPSLSRPGAGLLGQLRAPDDLLPENRLYVACQTNDDIPYVLRYAGADNLVIGSDYGHNDTAAEITALRHLREIGGLDETIVDKIMDANPTALYAL